MTDISMIVLKGHLLVEQLLTSLLSYHCLFPEQLRKAGLRFPQKAALIKAIVILPFPDELWRFLKLINQLRNDIAHELEPELKEQLETVRAMTDPRVKIAGVSAGFQTRFETDEACLASLISFWLGLLGAADSVLQLMKKSREIYYGTFQRVSPSKTPIELLQELSFRHWESVRFGMELTRPTESDARKAVTLASSGSNSPRTRESPAPIPETQSAFHLHGR